MVTESNMHRDMITQRPYAYLMYFCKLFGSKLKKEKKTKILQNKEASQERRQRVCNSSSFW